jgi:deazaflavin-dependent oxidoreductase (nitroreductase family)
VEPERAVRLDRSVGRQVYALHRWIYKATGGLVGHRSGTGPILLLTTKGRRTGRDRTKALLYMQDGDDYVVVASNGGREEPPAWYLNLGANPAARVQVGRRTFDATAHVCDAGEKERLWPRLTALYKGWSYYQTLTDRELPVVALRPAR